MYNEKPVRIIDPAAIALARKTDCEYCGNGSPIHVHHVKTRGAGGSDVSENLVSLCAACHDKVHRGLIRRAIFMAFVDARNLMRESVKRCHCGSSRLAWRGGPFQCLCCGKLLP